MTKHKHYDLIVAWANGAIIEYQPVGHNKEWREIAEPAWYTYARYRVRPPIKARLYLRRTEVGGREARTSLEVTTNFGIAGSDPGFLRWVLPDITVPATIGGPIRFKDAVVAWAEGKDVELLVGSESGESIWVKYNPEYNPENCLDSARAWHLVQKTMVRMYEARVGGIGGFYATENADTEYDKGFIRWLGDWVEVSNDAKCK